MPAPEILHPEMLIAVSTLGTFCINNGLSPGIMSTALINYPLFCIQVFVATITDINNLGYGPAGSFKNLLYTVSWLYLSVLPNSQKLSSFPEYDDDGFFFKAIPLSEEGLKKGFENSQSNVFGTNM